MKSRLVIFGVPLLVVLTVVVSACAASTQGAAQVELNLAPKSALPDFVREMPPQVQDAYRFAIANPEVLAQIPCYCGCGGMGHRNNLDCYVAAFNSDGTVAQFENHAAY